MSGGVHRALARVLELGGGLFQDAEREEKEGPRPSLGGPQQLPLSGNDSCDYEAVFKDVVLPMPLDGEADDMVWFVREESEGVLNQSMRSDSSEIEDTVFIRRRTDPSSFPDSALVDWRATVFVNIICQLEFQLTVAACRGRIEGREDNFAMTWVQRRVYASPSSPDIKDKEGLFRCTWPSLFFTVDDFKEAFSDMVVDDGLWCVELVTFDHERQEIPVFRGALTYEKLMAEYGRKTAQVVPINKFRKKGREVVFNMRGPGGRGAAQAAISKVGKQLHCCLANVSAVWVDVVHCLEKPVMKKWLHIPTDQEKEEEEDFLRTLSAASPPQSPKSVVAKASASASATAKAAQKVAAGAGQSASAAASKFASKLGGLRSTISFKRHAKDKAPESVSDKVPESEGKVTE
eukprot:TRINITY_DN22605_c0_g1_i1.p1 TRINITY_DN22605_c0_g1~~TRINITY_DN22605_c0_g1_i1.p1  ORF type:complete len:425 (+),score=136.27 TRINITY_DN22605_c0_g1_i1:62-1276(+)